MAAKKYGKSTSGSSTSRPRDREQSPSTDEQTSGTRLRVDVPVAQAAEAWERTFDTVPDLIAILDTQHRIVQANKAMADRLGLTRGECVGQTCYASVHGTDAPPSFCPHSQLLQDGEEYAVEVHEERLGGDFLVSVSPLRDASGRLVGSVHVARDITERKQAEKVARSQRDLSLALGDATQLDDVLRLCLQAALEVAGMDGGGIYLVGQPNGGAHLAYHTGLSSEFISHVSHYGLDSPNARLVLAGKPIYTQLDQLGAPMAELNRREGLRATAVVPISHGNEVIACLNLASRTLPDIPLASRSALEAVAGQMGGAIARLRAEQSVLESQTNLQTLFDSLDDFLFVLDMQGNILQLNRTVSDRLGYSPVELLGQSVLKVHPPNRHEEAGVVLGEILAGKSDACPIPLMTKSGTRIPVETRVSRGRWGDDDVLFGVSRDVSERERAEKALKQSEEKFRFLAENMADIVWTLDLNLRTTYVSPSIEKVLGFTPEERKRQTLEEILTPQSLKLARTRLADELRREEPAPADWDRSIVLEVENYKKDGSTVWLENRMKWVRDARGTITGIHGVSRDISERKHAENELRKSEERFRLIAETSAEDIWQLDRNGKVTYVSPGVRRIFGYTPEEAMGLAFPTFFSESELERAAQAFARALSGQEHQLLEFAGKKKDGSVVPIEVSVTPLIKDHAIVGVQGIARDITDRKRAEKELRESELRFRSLVEQAPDAVVTLDLTGRITSCNAVSSTIAGFAKEDLVGKHFTKIGTLRPKDVPKYLKLFASLIMGKPAGPLEAECLRKDGSPHTLEIRVAVFKDQGKIRGLQVAYRDVTERKQAEKALRESEGKYRSIFENSPEMIVLADARGVLVDVNSQTTQLLGYPREFFIGKHFEELPFWSVENKARLKQLNARRTRGERIPPYEIEFIRAGGGDLTFRLDGTTLTDSHGTVTHVLLMMTDVTAQRQAQDALRRSEDNLKRAQAVARVGSWYLDVTRNELTWSDETHRMFGVPQGAPLTYEAFLDHVHSDDRDLVHLAWNAALRDEPYDIEHRIVADGRVRWVRELAEVDFDEAGNAIAATGTVQDITERKRTEEALQFTQFSVDRAADSIFWTGPDARFVYVNDAACRAMGYSRDELLSMGVFDIDPDFPAEAWPDHWEEIRQRGAFTLESRHRAKDGRVFPVEITANLLEYEGQEYNCAFIRDITERKRAEEALSKAHERLKTIIDALPDLLFEMDREGRIHDYRSPDPDTLYAPPESFLGKKVSEVLPSAAAQSIMQAITKAAETGMHRGATYSLEMPAGLSWYEVSIAARSSKTREARFVALVRDVTDRKQAEEALRERERLQESLLNDMLTFVGILEPNGDIIFINNTPLKVGGLELQDIKGKKFYDARWWTHSDEVHETVKRDVQRCAAGESLAHDIQIETADGSLMWIEYSMHPVLDEHGAVQYLIPEGRDLTERKHVEKALRESEENFRAIYDSANDAIFVHDMETGRVIDVNRKMCEMYGYTPEEARLASVDELSLGESPYDQEHAAVLIKNAVAGEPQIFEWQARDKAGRPFWVEVNLKRAAIGKDDRILAIVRDITERKQAEETLHASEQGKVALLLALPDLFFRFGADGTFIDCHANDIEGMLIPPTEFLGKRPEDVLPPEVAVGTMHYLNQALSTGEMQIHEYSLQTDDTLHHYEARIVPIGNTEAVGIVRDVTDRKRSEEALRLSKEKYQGIFDESVAAIYVFDAEKNFIDSNQAGLDLLGYSREELLSMSIPGVDADPQVVLPAHEQLHSGGKLVNYEHQLRRKDGKIITVLNNSKPLVGSEGSIVGMQSTLVDITERKQAAEQLRLQAQLLDNVRESILATDMDGRVVYWGKGAEVLYGYAAEEVAGRSIGFVVEPHEEAEELARMQAVRKNGSWQGQYWQRRKDGSRFWADTTISLVKDSEGQPCGLIGIDRDITEQKQAEQLLQESENRYRTLVETAPAVIMNVDRDATILFINHTVPGFSVEETIGTNVLDYVDAEYHKMVIGKIRHVFETVQSDGYEVVGKGPQGEDAWYSTQIAPVKKDGNVIAATLIATDITAQVQAQRALRESEEKYRHLVDTLTEMVYSMDAEGMITFVSPAIESLLGYLPSDATGRPFTDFFHPEDLPRAMSDFPKALAGELHVAEYRLVAKSGDTRYVHTSFRQTIREGRVMGIDGVTVDITARRCAENALQASEARYRDLIAMAPDSIVTLDRWGRVTSANEAAEEITGFAEEELLGRRFTRLGTLRAKDIGKYIRLFVALLRGNPVPMLELESIHRDGSPLQLECRAVPIKENDRFVGVQVVTRDVTERKHVESERAVTIELLRLINKGNHLHDLMRSATTLLQEWSGCEAVGIRLRNGEDFPYFEAQGFASEFVDAENRLCALDHQGQVIRDGKGNPVLECMCGNVICGRFDPNLPFFTDAGSFWTNSTSELLASTSREDRQARTRNRCNGEGYESVALVPLRAGEEAFGLLQFNDRKKRRFTIERIRLFERLADSLATGLAERKAVVAMRESEAELSAIYENSPVIMLVVDRERRVRKMNVSAVDMTRRPKEESIGLRGGEALRCIHAKDDLKGCGFGPACDTCGIRNAVLDTFRMGKGYRGVEARISYGAEDKTVDLCVLVSTAFLSLSGQDMVQVCVEDITERKRMEDALQESERNLAKAQEIAHVGSFEWDFSADQLTCSDELYRIFEVDKSQPPSVEIMHDLIHPDDLHVFDEAMAMLTSGAGPETLQWRIIRAGGELRHLLARAEISYDEAGVPLKMVGVVQDITEQKRADESLRQAARLRAESEKLAATGRMAAEVAHEINNPLAGIRNGFWLIKDAVPEDHPDRDMVALVDKEIERIAHIVRQMYTIHSPQAEAMVDVTVGELIRDVQLMLEPLLREREVAIDVDCVPEELTVKLPRGSLHQILQNLIVNSVEASGEGQVVSVAAELTERNVRISVRDQGGGIPQEIQHRVFEPFFTSKTDETATKGMGLGLSTVKSIVESLGGTIEFETTPNQGTVFHVLLPLGVVCT